jgi:predicted Zn-ribbon and HTH transcriptional regulator
MKERIPREHHDTIRHEILDLLTGRVMTIAEISRTLAIAERDLYDHIDNLVRFKSLEILPARCLNCGFVFSKREKAKKPGKCPKCKSTRIKPPSFTYTP